jgi:uncharacterized protein (DUF58 family)
MKIGRLLGLIVLIFAFLLVGLATNSRLLLVLAAAPVLYLATALLTRPIELELEVERSISASGVRQGDPVTVTVKVTNRGSRLREIMIEDRLPRMLEILEGETRLVAVLETGQSIELQYTVNSRRGTQHFEFTFM